MKLTLAALFALSTLSAQPLSLYPDNPHYFLFAGQPTVLITSGEHYGAVINTDFNYKLYLDTLHADHLNLTRVFSGSYREVAGDFAIESNTLAPAPDKFLAPWAQHDNKFDLTRFDEAWFARMKAFTAYAGQRGIVVELVLFCPLYNDSMWSVSPMNAVNNINGIGNLPRADVLTLKDSRLTSVQDELVRKITSELRGFDNLYFEICNEPYFGGVTAEWQAHIAKVIADSEAGFAKKHLIAQNWANGSKRIDQPNPLVSMFSFHYSRPPASVAMNSALKLPIGNNETGFDGAADATYRIQGWDFLMAGGALYNNLDYSFTVGHEDGTWAPPDSTPGGGSVVLRHQLGYLRNFFSEIPFWRMHPMTNGISGGEGASLRGLEDPGKVYAIYMHQGKIVPNGKPKYQTDAAPAARKITLLVPPGNYSAIWRDPHTGKDVRSESFEVTAPNGETNLTSPVYAEDIALIVRATQKTK